MVFLLLEKSIGISWGVSAMSLNKDNYNLSVNLLLLHCQNSLLNDKSMIKNACLIMFYEMDSKNKIAIRPWLCTNSAKYND